MTKVLTKEQKNVLDQKKKAKKDREELEGKMQEYYEKKEATALRFEHLNKMKKEKEAKLRQKFKNMDKTKQEIDESF